MKGAWIEKRVAQYYLHSRDFKGIILSPLATELAVALDELGEMGVEPRPGGRLCGGPR